MAVLAGIGIVSAACNILTGASNLDEVPSPASDSGTANDAGHPPDATRDASKDTEPSDAVSDIDGGVDAPCDDATLGSDPQNCGMCGRSCGVEACEDAACVPRVLVSSTDVTGPLAADETYVYFLKHSSV